MMILCYNVLMLWIDPSKSNKYELYLPNITHLSEPDIKTSPSHISIQVSREFVAVWEKGPIDDSTRSLAEAVAILGQAFGELIIKGQCSIEYTTKESPVDFVTEMDTGIEMLFRIWMSRFFPDHKIIGEEGSKDMITPDDTVWYIDPVDGTTNYINGKDDVAMHIGCVKNGKPLISIVGIPLKNELYYAYEGKKLLCIYNEGALILGSEYIQNSDTEQIKFNAISKELNAKQNRVRSIGVNVIDLLKGKSTAFYKPKAKFWDVLPPAELIYFAAKDFFDIEVILSDGQIFCPFSNDENFINYLNMKHKEDCRIGLFIICPKNRPDIKATIKNNFGY
jgi:fructose-1,6-bisphosphatase/inositol monophosphatase family enzyme